MVTSAYDYVPAYFLRCHSKTRDSGDVQTQVWHCAFEPSTRDASINTSIVATCGGNSVCFIDCNKGEVVNKYYAPKIKDLLYTVCWTCVEVDGRGQKMVAAGGSGAVIHLISRGENRCLLTHSLKASRSIISSLLFHPHYPHVLFCATNQGDVLIFRLEVKTLDACQLSQINCLSSFKCELFDMAWSSDTLFVSSSDGLLAFSFLSQASLSFTNKKGKMLVLPESEVAVGQGSKLVDSVETLADNTVAAKCALHGCIYVFSSANLASKLEGTASLFITPLYSLRWSNTDNYFMYMGVSSEASLVCCGDDKGALWLYDLSHGPTSQVVDPCTVLPWPALSDPHNEKKRKLSLQTYDIVVDKVAVHSSAAYIVAVTGNNMVCIWKKV